MCEQDVVPVDYGPLCDLIGVWSGDQGLDTSPEPDGSEENPYFETITFDAAGEVVNAERQKLSIVRYHQTVSRKSDGEVFHDEIGYWLWDQATGVVMHSLTIPRGVCVLAGGTASANGDITKLDVAAKEGDQDWGIIQSPFMRDQARTVAFRHHVEVSAHQLSYSETTVLEIYDRTFDHTDTNVLARKV